MSEGWSKDEQRLLVELWNEDLSTKKIAEGLGKSFSSVKMYIQRHRKELGLDRRLVKKARASSGRPEFDKEWYGSVPYLHWSITKAWRCQ